MTGNGLISIESRFGASETIDRLVATVTGDAQWLAVRHDLGDVSGGAVAAVKAGMKKVVAAAAGMDR